MITSTVIDAIDEVLGLVALIWTFCMRCFVGLSLQCLTWSLIVLRVEGSAFAA